MDEKFMSKSPVPSSHAVVFYTHSEHPFSGWSGTTLSNEF